MMATHRTPYRSRAWFDTPELYGWLRQAAFRAEGFGQPAYEGRPLIGICNSWSELTHCNAHLRQLAEAVKRGVWQAGGFPLEFPVMSLGEYNMRPTTMLYRNLMSMDVEESITANPLDGVVLLGGCDKTTPALLMGAASADVPAIMVTGGPQLKGNWRGEELGSCTDCRRYHQELRAERITEEDWAELQSCIVRSPGHCMVMGTASTMAAISEALGMALPGNAAIPAVDSRRQQLSEAAGRQIVQLVEQGLRPSDILTPAAFENAIRTLHAVGGSTNAIVHLAAIAGRVGIDLPLSRFDELSRTTPFILNLKPSGEFLMEDFYYAGGVPALLNALSPLLDLEAKTVTGDSLGANIAGAQSHNPALIRSLGRAAGRRRRAGGAARLTGAGRRHHQAHRCLAGTAAPSRAGVGVRGSRRHGPAHRRSRPGRASGRRAGDAQRRAARRAGDAGVGIPAAAEKAVAAGRAGHGADQRRAHERHRLRHRGGARHAGIGGRRTASSGAQRRHDRAQRAGTPSGLDGRAGRNRPPSGGEGTAACTVPARLRVVVYPAHPAGG